MKKLVGLILSAILLTGLMAGCTGTPAGNSSTSAPETAPAESTTATTPQASGEPELAAWPRTYTDVLGNEVTLKSKPEKVISAFHAMFPDYFYTFGVYPIAVAAAETRFNHLSAYEEFVAVQLPEDIGAYNSLNFEQILSLEPDLIVITKLQEDVYDQFSQIAPTIVLDHSQINADWQYGVEEFAKIFGEEDKVDDIIAAVKASVAAGADSLTEFREKNETVVFLAVTAKELYPYSVAQLSAVYNDVSEGGLGLAAPEAYKALTDYSQALSLEAVAADYNPDHIFIISDNVDGDASEYIGQLENNSVWNNMEAVKNGHVYKIDRSIFAFNAPIATQFGVEFVVDSLSR